MARKKQNLIKIITLDTETYNGLIGGLKRIAVYDGETVTYGYTFTDIEPVLLQYAKTHEVHVYIHNMEFDARKVPDLFHESRIVWKNSLMINGKFTTISCKHYTCHDSFKLLPMSLSKLSKGFDVEHGKLDLWKAVQERYPGQYENLVDFLDRCDKDDPLYLEYLGYDVMSLYEVLEVLREIAGISEYDFVKRISTASLSRFMFKEGYKGQEFRGPFSNKTDYEMLCNYKWFYDLETEDFIREAYCGGRTEVFTPRLEKPGFHYDVNSLYPYVMSRDEQGNAAQYPVGKPQFTDKSGVAEHYYKDWQQYKSGLGFVNCRVYIPLQPIPPLPVKMGKLTFPCGEVYGTWTYEELDHAEKFCGVKILEYYGAVHFTQTFPVFERFVNTFYQLKEEGSRTKNEPLRTLAKLILNVGYGYTGMRRDDKTSLDLISNAHKHKEIVFANEELGFIEIPTEIKAEYIQVQVAAYVTSRARLVLLKALKDIIDRGGNVYYCDTDSIVCDIPMNDNMVDENTIGMWALEGKPVQGLFLRPKVYTELYEDENPTIKFKGVSRETQEQLDYTFYEEMYNDLETGEKDFRIVEKNRLTLRSIMYMQKEGLDFDYYETRDKKINYHTIEKREMDYAGNNTKPHYFPTLKDFENFSYKPVKPTIKFDMKTGKVIE